MTSFMDAPGFHDENAWTRHQRPCYGNVGYSRADRKMPNEECASVFPLSPMLPANLSLYEEQDKSW